MKDEFSDRRPLWPVWEKIQRLQLQPLKFIAVFVKREISVNYSLLVLLFTFTFSGNLSDVPGIHKNIKTMLHSDSQTRVRPIFNYSQHFITFDLNEKYGKLNKIRFLELNDKLSRLVMSLVHRTCAKFLASWFATRLSCDCDSLLPSRIFCKVLPVSYVSI